MCKSVIVSQTTLENYNTLLKTHAREVVKNRSAMLYQDQQGMSSMQFHGGSTLISVLIVVFILIGLYLAYHFIFKRCLTPFESNNDPNWRARNAALEMRRFEQMEMDMLRSPMDPPRIIPPTSGRVRDRDYLETLALLKALWYVEISHLGVQV